ncbi:MAG: prolyl oligopeptidase family serine peptidase [Candidatus Marisimplicoccus sp.]
MKKTILLILSITFAFSQENINYQVPSSEIIDLVEYERPPSVTYDSDKNFMLFLYRDNYKSIEELSQKELRLAGLRINPNTNITSRITYYNNIKIKNLKNKRSEINDIIGIPSNPKIANINWSPNQKNIAFTNTSSDGVKLWLLNLESRSLIKLSDLKLNSNIRDVINWLNDSEILIKVIPETRKKLIDQSGIVPSGPTISSNDGENAQNRTYQDLLKNKTDELNFEQLVTSDIYKVNLDGKISKWLDSDMYTDITPSPDGKFVMVSNIKKPFSYIVTYGRFPKSTNIYDNEGMLVSNLVDMPLIEELPQGFNAVWNGKRNFSWRMDKPSTITYMVALDNGDPSKEAEYRDELFELDAPFTGNGNTIFKSINRLSGIIWGNNTSAVAIDYWIKNRNEKTYLFNPSNINQKPKIIYDRNYQDRYSDPGSFIKERNTFNKSVLKIDSNNLILIGDGYSEKGQFPFVDRLNLDNLTTERIYESNYTDKLENLVDFDVNKKQLLVRIESKNDYPNYYFKNLNGKKITRITDFTNPFEKLSKVDKQVITYKRNDGLDLSGVLYLPLGYNKDSREKMPMIMWAYPREFKDKSSAGQNTNNPNEFTYPYYGSMVYWVTKGYVVLDDASFPIIGEDKTEPNDDFRNQLVENARAAINAVEKLGYIDKDRVAVGGHSYGAFMVANLLSHSDLFAAGIARSGAYNRTLTPFGFQSEERSYWQAPDVYNTMSPFMHADKMKTPLLLIHGEDDNNSGTYPMQSQRYFNALKGMGAVVRLVMLPKESHGYSSKESIYHVLWEQDQWLEKYVKNKK